MMRPGVVIVRSLIAALLVASGAAAQSTSLTTSGFTVTFPTAGGAEFAQGWVAATAPTSFTVNATTNSPVLSPRTTTVYVQLSSSTGGMTGTRVEWRRADQATWNALSSTFTAIEARAVTFNGTNDPWTQQIYWRYRLDWVADIPAETGSVRVAFQLTVSP